MPPMSQSKRDGPSTTTILVVALGCGVPALMSLALLVFLGIWQFLSPGAPSAAADGGATREPLVRTFATKNGLVTVRYPETFAASTPNEHAVMLQRGTTSGAQYVVVDAISEPASDQLEEVDRLVRLAAAKQLDHFVAGPVTSTTCHGEPGVASGGSYREGGTYELRACAFMKHGQYHRCAYGAPPTGLAAVEPLFKEICEAVELRAPADR
jgi:hypothetical protein